VVDSGTHLVLEVLNRGDQAHDLAVDGGVHTRKLSSGESQRLDLGSVSEGVHMSCTQSLHEFLGMKLQVLVVQPAVSSGNSANSRDQTPSPATGRSMGARAWTISYLP